MMNHWSFAAPLPVLIFGGCVWLVSAGLCVLSWRRRGGGWSMAGLEGLRFFTISLVGVTLLRPELVRRTVLTEKPSVVVLCDASASMQTRDLVLGDTNVVRRLEWLQQRRQGQFWTPLEKNPGVRVEDFAAPPATNASAAATIEEGTDLNQALEDVLSRQKNLKAVLVLSDGDWNLGKSPVTAATRYRAQNVPVYAIGVGSPSTLPDLALQAVSAPSYGLLGEQISIPYRIQSTMPRDVKTQVTLESPKRIEVTKQITISAGAVFQDAIVWSPRELGDYRLTLDVPVEKDEYLRDNNQQEFRVTIRTEKLKVLVVESRPRWEYRFLRNALARDPGVEVQCLLFHPGMPVGDGNNYIRTFPNSKEQLSGYDVVFLGDVGIGANELTTEDAELLKGLIEQQGSGLVFLRGRAVGS